MCAPREREVVATHKMPDGTEYRVLLERDMDAQGPEDAGAWPILRKEANWRGKWEAVNEAGKPYVTALNNVWDRDSSMEAIERFVRIFEGSTLFHQYGPNQATDYTYIAFDTDRWRDEMRLAAPPLVHETPLAEIQAWVEGEVYGWATEWRNAEDGQGDDDDWTDDESCWGFYGHKYAEESAREALDNAVKLHKELKREGRAAAELIRRKLGGHLEASMQVSKDETGHPALLAVLGPTEVSVYTSQDDGAIVVQIDSPTLSTRDHPSLRVYLNDTSIYDSTNESDDSDDTHTETGE